ncbi:unnamed protein product [Triticum turgidum subsp. durum]|uniref:Leucine-rich repeat-containing N-terminal plant-type domain-containing protein n=1 Tax=Triticum turgidum subsp. durum TaxID=4567 RepID=A0A9R0STU3_TRITD|nr:unnamed protein product [Triticum turgidum subsp. durum]
MSIALILLLVTLGVDGVSSLSPAVRTDDIEMAAMQAIAKSTGADRSLGWGVKSADPCDGTWPGVRCDKDSHVVAINASRAGLSGTLSGTDLVDLGYLTELVLSFNRLGDDMPILPRPLTYLTTLNLQSNSFMDMPQTFFRSFPALETVVLDDNWVIMGDITDVPPCPGLRSFSANNVTIYGRFPAYFGNTTLFPALESLSLARNDLKSGLPSSFAKNSKIKFLDISRQQDSIGLGMYNGFLDFVAGMTSLVEIHVAGDQFRGPLPDVSALVNLKVFDAADNNLCGPLKFPHGVAVNVTGNPQIGKDCP